MKKFFLLLFVSIFCFSAYSQVKKVAILEVIDRDESVSYAHKLMLRANLAKAITNTYGYEAYDRADMDAIMQEQNFQRTGMVSDDQIKRLGEMTGASYILVAEAVMVDPATMFITAKILNVETAKTENTDNALMASNPADIQHGCESLANKLLGIEVSSPVSSQARTPTKTSTQNVDQTHQKEERLTPSNTMKMNEGNYIVGQIISFPDGTRGVVFYLSDDEHGLAVSVVESKGVWQDGSRKELEDVYELSNDEIYNTTLTSGYENTNAILRCQRNNKAVAAAWCRSLGSEWYLPSSGELYYLFKIANSGNEFGVINRALKTNGYPIMDGWYWTSSEKNDKIAYNMHTNGWNGIEIKNDDARIRAVRAF